MKSNGQRHVLDPVASALTASIGIESDHPLYSFLYEAAATARHHRLPINVDAIAFTIAKTPALQEAWTAQAKAEGTLTHRLTEALIEYEMPAAGQRAA